MLPPWRRCLKERDCPAGRSSGIAGQRPCGNLRKENTLDFLKICAKMIIDRREAWVVPESKYSIGGIKNGISILFFYHERGESNAKQGSSN